MERLLAAPHAQTEVRHADEPIGCRTFLLPTVFIGTVDIEERRQINAARRTSVPDGDGEQGPSERVGGTPARVRLDGRFPGQLRRCALVHREIHPVHPFLARQQLHHVRRLHAADGRLQIRYVHRLDRQRMRTDGRQIPPLRGVFRIRFGVRTLEGVDIVRQKRALGGPRLGGKPLADTQRDIRPVGEIAADLHAGVFAAQGRNPDRALDQRFHRHVIPHDRLVGMSREPHPKHPARPHLHALNRQVCRGRFCGGRSGRRQTPLLARYLAAHGRVRFQLIRRQSGKDAAPVGGVKLSHFLVNPHRGGD